MKNVEWRSRTDFAEYAEVLGIETDRILTVERNEAKNTHHVIWSDGDDFYMVRFYRDASGVLQKGSIPVELPGFLERLEKAIEENLGGE